MDISSKKNSKNKIVAQQITQIKPEQIDLSMFNYYEKITLETGKKKQELMEETYRYFQKEANILEKILKNN